MKENDKFYLLTFNEDWADEHNVPALACFNEETFDLFRNKKFISDEELEEKKEGLEKYKQYCELCKNISEKTKNKIKDFPNESYYNVQAKILAEENLSMNFFYKGVKQPILDVDIRAYLGNNGGDFNEEFQDCFTGQDFIDKKYVKVIEVDKSFYDTFNTASLSRLSLCSIFQNLNDV